MNEYVWLDGRATLAKLTWGWKGEMRRFRKCYRRLHQNGFRRKYRRSTLSLSRGMFYPIGWFPLPGHSKRGSTHD